MSDVKNIEIDEAVVKAVASEVQKNIAQPSADDIATKLAEKMQEANEKTIKKDISEEKTRNLKKGIETMPKEVRFAKGLIAERQKDFQTLNEYNTFSKKQWIEKSDYNNVTTSGDGGALVPDPEFIAEVERLTDDYGIASSMATVRKTDRDSVTLLSGSNEVSFTKVGEATASNAQKLTYTASTVTLDKYILSQIMTSELVEDSAVNIFADATNEVARARAKLFDQLVFTDSTYGLLSATAGDTYKTQTIGANLAAFDFDDCMDAIYKVVGSARQKGAFFMHSTVWNELRQTKSGDGSNSSAQYYAGSPLGGVTPAINGYPVYLVDVLPDAGDITANEAFAVFGDLSRIKLHVKRVLETKTFDAGVVPDAGGTDFNLISQDAFAMRSTLRAVPQTRFEGAFTIIGTGTVS